MSSLKIREVGFLMGIAALITYGAYVAFPTWDDGWILLVQAAGGSFRENMPDRPLRGVIWQWLNETGMLWTVGYVLHWVGWVATGLVTMKIWTWLFPERRQYALAAGCLAMAPILCKTQLILVTTMQTGQIEALLVYAAMLLLIRWTTSNSRNRLLGISVLLILLGGLLSEYAVSAALAGGVLIFAHQLWEPSSSRKRAQLATAILLGTGVLSYFIYWLTASSAARTNVRPEYLLHQEHFFFRMKQAVISLVNMVWELTLGKALFTAGNLEIKASYAGVMVILFSLTLAVVMIRLSYDKTPVTGTKVPNLDGRNLLALVLAVLMGILPVVLTNRYAHTESATRFWLPVLPLAACATLAVIVSIIREAYTGKVIVLLVGVFACYSLLSEVVLARRTRDQTRAWGKQMEKDFPKTGIEVAIFYFVKPELSRPDPPRFVDYDLTAQLTRTWPADQKNRFWAYSGPATVTECEGLTWDRDLNNPRIQRDIAGVKRTGPVTKCLWVLVNEDGTLTIHSQEVGTPIPEAR